MVSARDLDGRDRPGYRPMTGTRQQTFSRDRWFAADAAWRAGGFSAEWASWRTLAARQGIIDPPAGTAMDSWGDDHPSQRAMLVRAIRETPMALMQALSSPTVRSWGEVITILIAGRDAMAVAGDEAEAAWRYQRKTEPMAPLRDIAATILDSLDRSDRRSK